MEGLLSTGTTPSSLYWKSYIIVCSYYGRTFYLLWKKINFSRNICLFFFVFLTMGQGTHFQKTNFFHRHIVSSMLREMISKAWGWLKNFPNDIFQNLPKAPLPHRHVLDISSVQTWEHFKLPLDMALLVSLYGRLFNSYSNAMWSGYYQSPTLDRPYF